jgi:hypothetical protein
MQATEFAVSSPHYIKLTRLATKSVESEVCATDPCCDVPLNFVRCAQVISDVFSYGQIKLSLQPLKLVKRVCILVAGT